jgi:hypothetical protein
VTNPSHYEALDALILKRMPPAGNGDTGPTFASIASCPEVKEETSRLFYSGITISDSGRLVDRRLQVLRNAKKAVFHRRLFWRSL